jgi:hypothetical protein
MAKLVDLTGKWAEAIGQAFVAFGSFEHVTVACLEQIPLDSIVRSTAKLGLAHRIELITEILSAYRGEIFVELATKLEEARIMTSTRNLIAHNPLVMDIYQRADGTIFHKEVIKALHKERQITLSELQDFAGRAERLASDLYGAAGKVFVALSEARGKPQLKRPNSRKSKTPK